MSQGLSAALDWEREVQAALMTTDDHAEGRAAFLEKRTPASPDAKVEDTPMASSNLLAGKVALVTGAGGGIGRDPRCAIAAAGLLERIALAAARDHRDGNQSPFGHVRCLARVKAATSFAQDVGVSAQPLYAEIDALGHSEQ